MKNPMAKTRPPSNPYEVYCNNTGWTWLVLKKYQADDLKPFARWFCAVYSPCLPSGEYELGDCYASEILGHATKIQQEDRP
jgi:hypothetical protein